jgi:excisionase family DNA binding protein
MAEKKRVKYQRRAPNIKRASKERATLSPRESVGITGIGITHTYDLLRRGEMPAIKVGKRFFIPRSALLKWLENAGSNPVNAA